MMNWTSESKLKTLKPFDEFHISRNKHGMVDVDGSVSYNYKGSSWFVFENVTAAALYIFNDIAVPFAVQIAVDSESYADDEWGEWQFMNGFPENHQAVSFHQQS